MKSQIRLSLAPPLAAGCAMVLLFAGCAGQSSMKLPSTGDNKSSLAAGAHEETPAERDFEAGTKRPPTAKTLYAFARVLATQGKDADAETVLLKIITEEPKFMPAYCDLAEVQMRQRRTDDAIRTLSAGLKISPKEPVLLNNRGMAYVLLGNYPVALQGFTAAAALAPDDARYRSNMALALGMLGRYDESLSLYKQIMPLDEAHYNLAVLCQARGDSPRAIQEFHDAGKAPAAKSEPALPPVAKAPSPVTPAPKPVITVGKSTPVTDEVIKSREPVGEKGAVVSPVAAIVVVANTDDLGTPEAIESEESVASLASAVIAPEHEVRTSPAQIAVQTTEVQPEIQATATREEAAVPDKSQPTAEPAVAVQEDDGSTLPSI
jgi:Flp pilus assembly protein TadD